MSKIHWKYTNASTQQVGLMRCTSCGKQIIAGRYRYRETDEAFLPQHEACSGHDPTWARMNQASAAAEIADKRRREAFAAFIAEHGSPCDLCEESCHQS